MAVFTLQKLRANELSRTFDVSVVSSAEIDAATTLSANSK